MWGVSRLSSAEPFAKCYLGMCFRTQNCLTHHSGGIRLRLRVNELTSKFAPCTWQMGIVQVTKTIPEQHALTSVGR